MITPPSHLRTIRWNVALQIIASMVFMAGVLLALGTTDPSVGVWAAGSSSLASSAFIVFAIPKSIAAEPKRIIGGYVIASIVGAALHCLLLSLYHNVSSNGFLHLHPHVFWVTAAVAVGVCTLWMILQSYQHPPAVGLALILVLDLQHWSALIVILVSACILALIRRVFQTKLTNLMQ